MIALVARDLKIAVRAGGGFGLALGFFLIVVVLVPLGAGTDAARLAPVAAGVLWVGALLACLLTLERMFVAEAEDGALEALATAPLPLEAVALAKAVAHWVTTGLPLTLAALPLGVLLHLPAAAAGPLFAALLLGTPALSLIGGFGAALTVGLKRGGLLLSLLVLPMYLPTLVFGAGAAQRGAAGLAAGTPLLLVAAVSAGCLAVLPFATAAALRINLR